MPSVVTVSEARNHLNLTADQESDAFLGSKIEAAEGFVANFIGKPLPTINPFPATLREAVLQLTAHFFENREATIVGVSMQTVTPGVFELMAPHREWSF